MPHTPHTPHTPQSTPHTPAGGASGPPSVPSVSQESTGNHNTSGNTNTTINNDSTTDIPSDLNFDPAAVIDGEGTGQEALNVSISYLSSWTLFRIQTLHKFCIIICVFDVVVAFTRQCGCDGTLVVS